jgi:hypothetical protein
MVSIWGTRKTNSRAMSVCANPFFLESREDKEAKDVMLENPQAI